MGINRENQQSQQLATNTSSTIEERISQTHIKALGADIDAAAVISNVFRVAVMFRNRAEQSILANYNLSFSGFTVLWVLWVWGKKQPHALAKESGVAKATLTGIVQTLSKHNLVTTEAHESDSRRKYIALSQQGQETITEVYAQINQLESAFVSDLQIPEMQALSQKLRVILNTVDAHSDNAPENEATEPLKNDRTAPEK